MSSKAERKRRLHREKMKAQGLAKEAKTLDERLASNPHTYSFVGASRSRIIEAARQVAAQIWETS